MPHHSCDIGFQAAEHLLQPAAAAVNLPLSTSIQSTREGVSSLHAAWRLYSKSQTSAGHRAWKVPQVPSEQHRWPADIFSRCSDRADIGGSSPHPNPGFIENSLPPAIPIFQWQHHLLTHPAERVSQYLWTLDTDSSFPQAMSLTLQPLGC